VTGLSFWKDIIDGDSVSAISVRRIGGAVFIVSSSVVRYPHHITSHHMEKTDAGPVASESEK